MQSHEVAKIETLDLSNQKRINEIHRFGILVLGTLCCICTSFSYVFNLISGTMQEQYNLTQRDLSTISSVGLVFTYFALPYAFLFDYLGPIPVAALATAVFPVGTICLALTFMKIIKGSVVKLTVFNSMMGAGTIMYDLVGIMPTLSYFPTRKGYVTAVLKTFTGLGSALVGTFYIGFFNKKAGSYLFFLAAYAALMGVMNMIFMRLPPYHLTGLQMKRMTEEQKAKHERTKAQYLAQKVPMWRFIWAFTVIIFLVIYLLVQSVVTAFVKVSHATTMAFAIVAAVAVGIFCCLCLPWTACCHKGKPIGDDDVMDAANAADAAEMDETIEMPVTDTTAEVHKGGDVVGEVKLESLNIQVARLVGDAGKKNEPGNYVEDHMNNENAIEDARSHTSAVSVKKQHALTELDYIAPQYQGTFFRDLLTTELWAIFWGLFVAVGGQFVIIYNPAYVVGALMGKSLKPEVRTLLTVINGTASAVGRLFMSAFEVQTQRRPAEKRIPITICLYFPTVATELSLLFFLVLPGNLSLLLPIALASLANGIVNSAVVLTTRTIYAKDPAKHYHFCFLSISFCSIVFLRGLYGEWYSRQAEKYGSSRECYHRSCVQVPLIILICLGATAFLTNTYVHLRYRAFNNRTLKARALMREEEELQNAAAPEPVTKNDGRPDVYIPDDTDDRLREAESSPKS